MYRHSWSTGKDVQAYGLDLCFLHIGTGRHGGMGRGYTSTQQAGANFCRLPEEEGAATIGGMPASACKTLLASLSLLGLLAGAGPAWAHGEEHHGHATIKGDAPRSFASKPALGTAATCPVSGER